MLINERKSRRERLLQVANEMMTAARTAPKAKGVDIIEIALVTGDSITKLSQEMMQYCEETGMGFLARDAENILSAEAIVLIGTKNQTHGLNCGYCGFPTCVEKMQLPTVPCALTSTDVGIALGAACSVAADNRVDNRVLFSAGRVAKKWNYLPECSNIYAIPISCSSKNPFFDRIPKT
jgi:uncharacterized ferredoxin-like protein